MKKVIYNSISYIFQKCLGIEMGQIKHVSVYYQFFCFIFHYSLKNNILHNCKLCLLYMDILFFLKNNLKIFSSTYIFMLHASFQICHIFPKSTQFIPFSSPHIWSPPFPVWTWRTNLFTGTSYPNVSEHRK